MCRKFPRLLSVVCLCLLPASALAQCPRSRGTEEDKLCWNLQYVLYAAQTDFREFTFLKKHTPDVSFGTIKVPCELSAWLNNVAMYMCSADVSLEDGQEWYAKAIADLQRLQNQWQFKIESPGTDHFVDAGPPGCEVPPDDGPYFGQCPLHLQEVKQPDGTSKLHLWVNSYTSPYLGPKPPPPPGKARVASPASDSIAPVGPACDDLCRGLKRVFEARASSFQELLASQPDSSVSSAASNGDAVNVRLPGASACSVDGPLQDGAAITSASSASHSSTSSRAEPISTAIHTRGVSAQYVCFWPEDSASAAESRFRDLCSRLEVAMPSRWSAKQEDIVDPLTGQKVTSWLAVDPANRPAVRLYLSGHSVGLHISGAD